jgi:lipopolysaccharide transport system permease protein
MQTIALKPLFTHRDLLIAWILRTIRARYQQSILGGLWAILQPAATVAIFTVIFTMFIPVDTGSVPYVVFSYTALVPWLLFSTSITEMVDSLVVNMNLVSKIYFPREILPIAAALARLLDFGIAYGLLVLVMVFYQMPVFAPSWFYLPIILVIQLALTLGLGLIGAALNVFYRDIKHLFILVMQLWFYATPIIYPVSVVPEQLRPFYFFNPMAGVIEAYRAVMLGGEMPGSYLIISALIGLVALLVGHWLFKRVEPQFADVV